MNKQAKGFGFYIAILLVIFAVYTLAKLSLTTNNSYTYQDFRSDVKEEKVKEIVISQNKEIPTGYISVT